jgi:hypothetical protein
MAIPVHLQQFKAAGIYRVVFDHSTILNQDTQMLRLVVGYSEKGPFNVPVLVKDPFEFRSIFGDISKRLEKRGIYFHRLALQMLQVSPILCLNLKKFDGETVQGATISTDFNPKFNPIDTVTLNIEDIYDTTRFWTLDAEKLNDLRSVEGALMDQYINISATNVKATSCTYFIRKASGTKVSGYNITVSDWYSDEDMPDYMEPYKNNLVSDFFAEIYVFKGKFEAKQVLASNTLKNYFIVTNELDDEGNQILKLRDKVINAFGESVDTLDALYKDETSGALGHYVGAIIPYFKNKQGAYACLDVVFNSDLDTHNLMMSFNKDLLEEENAVNLDLSGRIRIPSPNNPLKANTSLSIDKIYAGTATTSILGNVQAPVIADVTSFLTNVWNPETETPMQDLYVSKTRISGTLYVKSIVNSIDLDNGNYAGQIELVQVGSDQTVTMTFNINENQYKVMEAAKKLGVKFDEEGNPIAGKGTYWPAIDAFMDPINPLAGPERVITSLSRLEHKSADGTEYTDIDENIKPSLKDVEVLTKTHYVNTTTVGADSVYGSSVSFIDFCDDNWEYVEDAEIIKGVKQAALIGNEEYDTSLLNILQKGDCILAKDGAVDENENGEDDDEDGFIDNVNVQEFGTLYYEEGEEDYFGKTVDNKIIVHHAGDFKFHYILISAEPWLYEIVDEETGAVTNNCLVRVDAALNQEIGTMIPQYLEGYIYKNDRPLGTGMYAKVKWQEFILSTITDYKGLRTALLNKSEIDYRYVVDTFESFPVTNLKNVLSYLCKEKQSAFCIANFPSVKNFIKCPYTSFTDSKGVFNVEYVVKGFNKKKSASMMFSLPSENDGASFIAFYTPLKFTDGYLDTLVPAAGLVSNLFVNKYISRQPYYIVAGPNYGNISASGLVGPDYKYSMDELQLIEPFGVNVMVYRPNFGTFINANQTAKQTPVSALSKVNVRELVIYLQDEIEKVLQAYQWEFNNQRTRNAILDRANQICSIIAANGGIQAYKNIMDESNNTPDIIDNEMAVITTHIEPGMGCGKMVQELHIWRTGQMNANISD